MTKTNVNSVQSHAILRNARTSAQKARLVCDLIRGKSVEEALNICKFSTKKAAKLIYKLLNSAVANATNNQNLDVTDFRVKTIYADEGPTMKRIMPRAKGRADHIRKRTSHITVVIAK